jgi:Uroporphyrinogen decarboxylase (URO-D)
MPDSVTPRQLVQAFLQGAPPARPLFLPIIFSHGARIENLPLHSFLTNPTKISNALRQIRGRVRADGVTCYFDSLLEAEALGATVERAGDEGPRTLRWPQPTPAGEFPQGLRSPGDAAKSGRVGVAVEVIKRLKAIMRDDCLLMAGVSGPYTLAALLLQCSTGGSPRAQDFPAPALDLATETMTAIARAFLEAGATAIILHEEELPILSGDAASDWASRLGTAINIVRFYQALPMLLLPNAGAVAANRDAISQQTWECVVCPALEAPQLDAPGHLGIALPLALLESGAFQNQPASPVVVTTAGDVPATADMERLNKLWETIRPR